MKCVDAATGVAHHGQKYRLRCGRNCAGQVHEFVRTEVRQDGFSHINGRVCRSPAGFGGKNNSLVAASIADRNCISTPGTGIPLARSATSPAVLQRKRKQARVNRRFDLDPLPEYL